MTRNKNRVKYISACKHDTDTDTIQHMIEEYKIDPKHGFIIACANNKSVEVIKYFIDVFKMNPTLGFINACRYNDCLDIIRYFILIHSPIIPLNGFAHACQYNGSVQIIQYFINEFNADPVIGMTHACRYNPNPNIIQYFIDNHTIDPIVAFANACQYTVHINIIKYFIDNLNLDPLVGFLHASTYNSNLEIFKFFVEDLKIDHTINHGLKRIFWHNKSIDIIKYLIVNLNVDYTKNNIFEIVCLDSHIDIIAYFVNELKVDPYPGFHRACHSSQRLDIIRYFIEVVKVDPHKLYTHYNSFEAICSFNPSLEIFKYFVEVLKFKADDKNDIDECFFLMTCHNERNINIIKYCIDVLKVDVNTFDGDGDIIDYALKNNDQELIRYIINDTTYKIVNHMQQYVSYIDNVDRLQQVVDMWDDEKYCIDYDIEPEDVIKLYNKFNPLLLTKEQITKYTLVDPFSDLLEWKEFKIKVNDVQRINKSHNIIVPNNPPYTVTRSHDEKIFINNGVQYYGDRIAIYNNITPLTCILEMDTDDPIDIQIPVSDFAMRMYLSKVEQNVNKFHLLDKKEFIDYVKFLDQYPVTNYTIRTIEIDMINYMINNNLNVDHYMMDVIERYNLRYMYAWAHNKF